MLILFAFAAAIVCVAFITAMTFFSVRRLGGSKRAAIAVGGLIFPVASLLIGIVDTIYSQEVDGTPPGMVLAGLLLMFAVFVPFAFLLCLLLARTSLGYRRLNGR